MIDAAIGEASDLRYRSAVLQRAVAGLMETISAWRKVAFADRAKRATRRPLREANAVHDLLPRDAALARRNGLDEKPAELRDACCSAVRSLTALRRRDADAEALGG